MGILLSSIALVATYMVARRSIVRGIVAVLVAGYGFGIVRANLPQLGSYFIFDGAVVGIYAAQIKPITGSFQALDGQRLKHWVALLILWPLVLFFIPQQDPVVQAVGLRGNIFLLPFILIGAKLDKEQIYKIGLAMGALNLGAFAAGVLEFIFGVQRFFPRNPITDIIYRSNDVGTMDAFRIPSLFANAHTFAAMMVISLPWIVGAWVQRHREMWHKHLLLAGMLAAMLGVFMSAVRIHFLVLLVLITVFTFSSRLRPVYRLGWIVVLVLVSYVVSTNQRMQRFTTLENPNVVSSRIEWSVNSTLLDAVTKFPFGVGLGGGGTSIPYFLQDRVHMPIAVESELGRIQLETGLMGVAAWIAFIVWIFTRPGARRNDPWYLGVRLAWFACASFVAMGLLGIGLLTTIPCTAVFLMLLGWISTHHTGEADHKLLAFRPAFDQRRLHGRFAAPQGMPGYAPTRMGRP